MNETEKGKYKDHIQERLDIALCGYVGSRIVRFPKDADCKKCIRNYNL